MLKYQCIVNSDTDQVNYGTVGTRWIHWCSFVIHVSTDRIEWLIPYQRKKQRAKAGYSCLFPHYNDNNRKG